jgi:hypothetical protein
MENCQDVRDLPDPIAIGRLALRTENTFFDGTKLPMVVEPSHNHYR